MAEGLVNARLGDRGVVAYSAGSHPSGRVHPYAKRVLETQNAWHDRYHSKRIDEVADHGPFDLVVTVCDNAKEACPVLPGAKTIHVGFEDPDGKPYEAFEATRRAIEARLLPIIEKELKI